MAHELRGATCREMEHVITLREGSVLSCGRMYRGALRPRGGRGEMPDRTNEVALGAWRWGRGCSWGALGGLGTFILRTFLPSITRARVRAQFCDMTCVCVDSKLVDLVR